MSWATGTYQNYSNPSAPSYPVGVLYDPVYPDPASVNSYVGALPFMMRCLAEIRPRTAITCWDLAMQ